MAKVIGKRIDSKECFWEETLNPKPETLNTCRQELKIQNTKSKTTDVLYFEFIVLPAGRQGRDLFGI